MKAYFHLPTEWKSKKKKKHVIIESIQKVWYLRYLLHCFVLVFNAFVDFAHTTLAVTLND